MKRLTFQKFLKGQLRRSSSVARFAHEVLLDPHFPIHARTRYAFMEYLDYIKAGETKRRELAYAWWLYQNQKRRLAEKAKHRE